MGCYSTMATGIGLDPIQDRFDTDTAHQQCAVVDNKGNHCPDDPEHQVLLKSGKIVDLCERCFKSWVKGAWNGNVGN